MCLFIVCYTVVLNTPEYYAIENQAICVHNPNPTLSYAVCTLRSVWLSGYSRRSSAPIRDFVRTALDYLLDMFP